MNFERFRALSAHHRALVTIAVLLDGHEAQVYLDNDSHYGNELAEIAGEIASLQPDFRNFISGHHLRSAIEDLAERRGTKERLNEGEDE